MPRTVEAIIDPNGAVKLRETVHLSRSLRAIVTIFDDPEIPETALLSEPSLSEDWSRLEEDEAWSHLQPAR